MTVQNHAQRVHPANPAEVIANVAYQCLACISLAAITLPTLHSRTTLPGKCRQSTPSTSYSAPELLCR